jgi:hypothetical protein
MVALPDGRIVASYDRAAVRILPSGEATRLQNYGAAIADITVDPDFQTSHFVYLATITEFSDTAASINVVRMREARNRLVEEVVIAAELPAGKGRAAISIGPDRRIYLAVPGDPHSTTKVGPYDGSILRLTRDGSAAGYERMHSPILGRGVMQPSSFTWLTDRELLLASPVLGSGSALASVGLTEMAEWPAPVTPIRIAADSSGATGIQELAAFADRVSDGKSRLLALGSNPPALFVVEVNPDSDTASMSPLSLESWMPLTFARTGPGSFVLAAMKPGSQETQLLRLDLR